MGNEGTTVPVPVPVPSEASATIADDHEEKKDEVSEIAVERSLMESGILSAKADEDGVVPVIDMNGPEEEVSEAMWRAAKDVGFFSVVNHGIPSADIEGMFGRAERFFAQPLVDKERQSPFDARMNSGFEYFQQVRPSTGTPDQKESLQMTSRRGCMDGRWPSGASVDDDDVDSKNGKTFRSTCEDFMERTHGLACRILDLLERHACTHLTPGTLGRRSHTLWGSDGQCTLRLLHYPPVAPDDLEALLGGSKAHWRAGPHTDWSTLTLLFQRIGQAGLECRANPRANPSETASWIPVPPVEGGIAINIGDMLGRWSDGALCSNLHRVRMPLTRTECLQPRYSLAFFAQADKSVLLESRDNEPITAGDYILSRIRSNYSK